MRHDPPTSAELTVDELGAIAIRNGKLTTDQFGSLIGDCHNNALAGSRLRMILLHDLHAMFCRGELTLCTRQESPCPVHHR